MVKTIDDIQEKIAYQNPELAVSKENGRTVVDFYLINEIEDIKDYIDFLRECKNAIEGDKVIVHINCYGGDVDVALNIFDTLKNTQADVTISVEGVCASAASMILLAANTWEVSAHSYVMVHAWSGFEYGKWHEMEAQHDFAKHYYENMFKEVYKDFLSDAEISDCLRGKDFYFTSGEVVKRLNNKSKDLIRQQKVFEDVAAKYEKIINEEVNNLLKKETTTAKQSKKKTKTTKKA